MNKKDIQSFYTYLQSQQTAQQFLLHCYEKNGESEAKKKSYANQHAFLYYVKHGLQFYETGKKLQIIFQPMLFFYGMVHLIKALLLTKRPHYPETTKVLAHGVSTRKRKKKQYTFLHDEVKIQQQGLFLYFSKHLFSIDHLPFEKVTMEELLASIPEMNLFFSFQQTVKMVPIGSNGTNMLAFPIEVLDHYHVTEHAFARKIVNFDHAIYETTRDNEYLYFKLTKPITTFISPFYLNYDDNQIYFPLNREHLLPISEIMIHYLLLYNLSMISRYETEWWGDLVNTMSEMDYPFIKHFLQLTAKKIPFLLGVQLKQMYG